MDQEALLTSEKTTIPSSPSAAVFSDEAARASTPPSSPPGFPWEQDVAKDEDVGTRAARTPAKTAFSVLGKRKALEALCDNARRPAKRLAATTASSVRAKPLTQMQISLGQEVQKKCKDCGMEYIASSAEDRKLHDKYHRQNTEGYDIRKAFVQKARPRSTFAGVNNEDTICAVDCSDKPARKKRAQAVLEIVQRELGAVEIPEKDIWNHHNEDPNFKYRAYLYVRGGKCIGFLLVQKIEEAYHVVEPLTLATAASQASVSVQRSINSSSSGTKLALAALKARQQATALKLAQALQLSKDTVPARLGILRIWTSSTHRSQGIAVRLLDAALEHYNQFGEVSTTGDVEAPQPPELHGQDDESENLFKRIKQTDSKEIVAFSQPTEAGTRLARRWFGRGWGWGVYVD